MTGSPIRIRLLPQLTAHGGKLLSRHPEAGTSVYAASFIRKREIVLETELLSDPPNLRLILIHELFHFVWVRFSNRLRAEYSDLLARELHYRAKGELGESSGLKKSDLIPNHVRSWRDYVCESFCDTAAWLYSGISTHPEFTLAERWRRPREQWFQSVFSRSRPC